MTTARTRTARIAAALATVAAALTVATAASAQLTPGPPITQDGPTLVSLKFAPPCLCQPLDAH